MNHAEWSYNLLSGRTRNNKKNGLFGIFPQHAAAHMMRMKETIITMALDYL